MDRNRLKHIIICLEPWHSKRVACYACIIYKKRGYLQKCTDMSICVKNDIKHFCSTCDLSFLTKKKLSTVHSILYYKLCI